MVNEKENSKIIKQRLALKVARRELKTAKKLLARALRAIPDYTDGRHDKICDDICTFLETPDV